jgi:hypothetical protein
MFLSRLTWPKIRSLVALAHGDILVELNLGRHQKVLVDTQACLRCRKENKCNYGLEELHHGEGVPFVSIPVAIKQFCVRDHLLSLERYQNVDIRRETSERTVI